MAKPSKKTQSVLQLLADQSLPVEHRSMLLRTLIVDPDADGSAAVHALLESHTRSNGESLFNDKVKQVDELLQQMQSGPMRNATFIDLVKVGSVSPPQAFVVLDDGAFAYTSVPDEALSKDLRRGDRVILEGKGRALLSKAPHYLNVGDEAQFERRIDEKHVEVSLGQERHVFVTSQKLSDQLDAGKVEPGTTLVVSSRQFFADHALPPQDSLAHYRFLVKQAPPEVQVERDIGSPPAFIEELTELIRLEMTTPDLRRRYRLRRCAMKLLSGVSGSGKTLAIHALWRKMYEVMSEVTGAPIAELPFRVFKLRLGQVLSMWFGESDKNIDRFFQEIEQLAEEKFTVNGREYLLPVLVIMEEVDGVARARGDDGIYDRVLSSLLQRLDSTREELRNKIIVFIGTTNEPGAVDRAFFRRLGATVESFGNLKKRGFVTVLEKHLDGLPFASSNGCTPKEIQRRMINELTAWLYSPNGSDKGLIELVYAGSATADIRYRRDLLTGSLVDRAVQQAAASAVNLESNGSEQPGLNVEILMKAFDRQFRNVADQINEHNARHYLEVPDGVRVATVRRIPQPAILPIELERQTTHLH